MDEGREFQTVGKTNDVTYSAGQWR